MLENLPLDPKKEIFKWGPAPFLLYYGCNPLVGLFENFSELYDGYGWPTGLILSKNRRMIWMHEEEGLNFEGGRLLFDHLLDKEKRDKAWTLWRGKRDALRAAGPRIDSFALAELSDGDLLAEWRAYNACLDEFWAHGLLPELGGYGAIPVLREHIAAFVPEEEIPHVMEILTAPEEPSFFQREELDLAKTSDIAAHQREYYWLNNSYAHVETLGVEFFEKRKTELPAAFAEETSARFKRVRTEKEAVRIKYGLSQEVMDIAAAMCDSIVWQDERKEWIWRYLHYVDLFLNEAVRRFGFDKEQCLNCRVEEIFAHVEQGAPLPRLEERDRGYGFLIGKRKVTLLQDDIARHYWELYVGPKETSAVSEFKGTVACKGKGPVHGTVRIVQDPRQPGIFNEGDILVASMTTPEYVFLMKKATALVMDAGGLTSHAAIVSRELGVPCIVGTKIATQVLKDGDMVEVDAEKGIVRKI